MSSNASSTKKPQTKKRCVCVCETLHAGSGYLVNIPESGLHSSPPTQQPSTVRCQPDHILSRLLKVVCESLEGISRVYGTCPLLTDIRATSAAARQCKSCSRGPLTPMVTCESKSFSKFDRIQILCLSNQPSAWHFCIRKCIHVLTQADKPPSPASVNSSGLCLCASATFLSYHRAFTPAMSPACKAFSLLPTPH
jgi:hypothetical protein